MGFSEDGNYYFLKKDSEDKRQFVSCRFTR